MKRGPADAPMETQDISPLTSLSKEHYAAQQPSLDRSG
jgi:hypothetical protein